MESKKEYYFGFIHKQGGPMTQDVDATVTTFNGEIMRIVSKSMKIDDLALLAQFYPASKGYLKARYSRSLVEENRYLIDEILD